MLALFPSMKYKAWYAIGEFIDNSLQSYLGNKVALDLIYDGRYVLDVHVDFDHEAGVIRVSDNAAGIYSKDISRAFTPAVPPADNTGLSQFGIGMKSAACWFAREFRITTTALNEPVRRSVQFDVPRMVEDSRATLPVMETPAEPHEHGTTLELWNLHQKIPVRRALGTVRDYLRSIYRNYIDRDDIRIFVAGQELKPRSVSTLVAPRWDNPQGEIQTWKKSFAIPLDDGTTVTGWAALREKGTYKETGFALSYRKKVVQGADVGLGEGDDLYRPKDIFGASNSFISLRLHGELDVSEVGVSYSKDSVAWSKDVELEFLEKLNLELDAEPLPLLSMARHARVTETNRAVNKTVNDALESAVHALSRDVEAAETNGELFLPQVGIPLPFSGNTEAAMVETHEDQNDDFPPIGFGDTERTLTISGVALIVRVTDEPSNPRFVNVTTRADGDFLIEINRSHKYVLSFGNLPGQDFEATLRIGIALGLSEIKAARAGVAKYKYQLTTINQLLSGELAERIARV